MCYSYYRIFKTVKRSNSKINAVNNQQNTVSTKVDLAAQTDKTDESTTVDNQEESKEISKNKPIITVGFPKPERKRIYKEKEELRLTFSFLVVLGVFISCIVPNCIYLTLSLIPDFQVPRAVEMIAITIGYVFGTANPIIFLKMNRKYMDALTKIINRLQWLVRDGRLENMTINLQKDLRLCQYKCKLIISHGSIMNDSSILFN